MHRIFTIHYRNGLSVSSVMSAQVYTSIGEDLIHKEMEKRERESVCVDTLVLTFTHSLTRCKCTHTCITIIHDIRKPKGMVRLVPIPLECSHVEYCEPA